MKPNPGSFADIVAVYHSTILQLYI